MRRTFVERLPQLVPFYGRRTQRLTATLASIGLQVGAEVGARISRYFGVASSGDTLLRIVRQSPEPAWVKPRVIGIDDWAFRKGRRYGTVVIDLERQRPIALLPDREVETVTQWLRQQPQIEIISRDRAHEYIQASTLGAPQAIQVADRWHLLRNAGDALHEMLRPHAAQLRKWASAAYTSRLIEASEILRPSPSATQQRQSAAKRAARLERYQQVHQLHQSGWNQTAIAHHMGLNTKTVRHFLTASIFPELQPLPSRSTLDPFKAYLLHRWNEGCHSAVRLTQELETQGYTGSITLVRAFMTRLRKLAQPLPSTSVSSLPISPPLTPRQVTYLLLRPPHAEGYATFLEQFFTLFPELKTPVELFQVFAAMLRDRRVEVFTSWMQQARHNTCTPLRRFARGLQSDEAAVRAALALPWSNGQVEGQINRLKFIKRQGYGRANFDLLRLRVLHPTQLHDNCG
jgi:transposase